MIPAPSPAGPPRLVLLFTGHMVDAPGRPSPRFPESAVPAAAGCIAAELDRLGAGPGDLALTQGAAGGDLLFTEAAQARGVAVQWLQPLDEAAFLQASVKPFGPAWSARYAAARARLDPARPILAAPAVLGPLADGDDPYARCNLWLLDSALARGPERVRLIALWNGAPGDGPGGTDHLVRAVQQRRGQVSLINPADLPTHP